MDTLLLFFVEFSSLNAGDTVTNSNNIVRTCRAGFALFAVPDWLFLIAGFALLCSFIENWRGRGALAFIVDQGIRASFNACLV